MRQVVVGCCLFVSVLWLSFSAVFFFFPLTPLQEDVRSFLNTGEGVLGFSEEANNHMVDVFNVLRVFQVVGFLSLLVVLYSSIQAGVVRVVGYVLVSLPVLLALLPWSVLFRYFHLVFFPMGNWQFPPDSLLIQTYPESFFVLFSAAWACLLVLIGVVFVWFTKKV
ncbi:MAG: DUF1461 domain-containing protein [Candidatus Woesearchaeota archaeon]